MNVLIYHLFYTLHGDYSKEHIISRPIVKRLYTNHAIDGQEINLSSSLRSSGRSPIQLDFSNGGSPFLLTVLPYWSVVVD